MESKEPIKQDHRQKVMDSAKEYVKNHPEEIEANRKKLMERTKSNEELEEYFNSIDEKSYMAGYNDCKRDLSDNNTSGEDLTKEDAIIIVKLLHKSEHSEIAKKFAEQYSPPKQETL